MNRLIPLLTVFAVAAIGCAGSPSPANVAYDPQAVPAGAVGDMVRYGRELILHTRAHLAKNVGANMDCAACHLDAGTKARGGSFVGVYGQFPQWNQRAKRVIMLQDRLAECFLYSMNGKPPPYQSRPMVAMTAYIAYLSRDVRIGATPDPAIRFTNVQLRKPDKIHGAQLYAQRCETCHGANGAGSANGNYPPLWGPLSFNTGAGMSRLSRMAGFVRYNMPQNAPGSLSDQESADVAAFVLQHARPRFHRGRLVTFASQRASYF